MDPQHGIEMETVECVLEKAEQQPASSSSSEKDFISQPNNIADCRITVDACTHDAVLKSTDTVTDSTEPIMDNSADTIHRSADSDISKSIEATIDKCTGAVISRNVGLSNEAVVEKNTEIADDKHIDTVFSMPTIAAVSNTDATFDLSANAEYEVRNNGTGGVTMDSSAINSVSSNVDSIMHSTTDSKDSFIGRISEFKIEEDRTRAIHNASAEVIDGPVVNASSDTSSNEKLNDACAEVITKSEESGALHKVENAFPPDHIMIMHSGDSSQPAKPKDSDSHYDSEVEIIDCTSESLEDQPAAGNAGPSDPSSIVDGTSLDSNTDIDANQRGNDLVGARTRYSKNKKRALYKTRCTNLRLFRMKQKSGEVTQPPKAKNRVSHCLDKLTKNNLRFMENFDPKMSNRERRKMQRKTYTKRQLRGDLYGLNGALLSSGKNLCDCMNPNCPGCHFPCPRCQSPKCGHECRVNRKWTYEEIEIDGTDIVIKPYELIESFSNNS